MTEPAEQDLDAANRRQETRVTKLGLRAALAAAALYAVVQATELGNARHLHGDESFYVQAADIMLNQGDWLAPRYEDGSLRVQKPILCYWFTALPYALSGCTLAGARLPAWLASLATLWVVFELAVLLFDDRLAGAFAACVLASMQAFYSSAHQERPDIFLVWMICVSLYFFARIVFRPGRERRDAMWAYLFCAAAVLTKGLPGVFFIFGTLGLFVLVGLRGERRIARRFFPLVPILVFVVVASSWYVAMWAKYGREFYAFYIDDNVKDPFQHGARLFVLTNLMKYAKTLPIGAFPWGVVLLLAVVLNDAGARRALGERKRAFWFLACWAACVFGMCLVIHINRKRYLLPMFPVLAIWTGQMLAAAARRPDAKARGFALGLWLCVALCGVMAAYGLAAARLEWAARARWPWPRAAMTAALVAAGAGLIAARRRRWAAAPLMAAAMILALRMANMACPLCGHSSPLEQMAPALRAAAGRASLFATVGLRKGPRALALIYAHRRADQFFDEGNAERWRVFLAQEARAARRTAVVIPESLFQRLPDSVKQDYRVTAKGCWAGRRRAAEQAPWALASVADLASRCAQGERPAWLRRLCERLARKRKRGKRKMVGRLFGAHPAAVYLIENRGEEAARRR